MNITYHLINPTGNITALVETPVLIENQVQIAAMIMDNEKSCEQVGYISDGDTSCDIKLRMAGGEFCGNATMSTAAFFCRKIDLPDGEEKDVKVKVYGIKDAINVHIIRNKDSFLGKVSMPYPVSITNEKFFYEGNIYHYPMVSFNSISHIIVEDSMPVVMAERAVVQWCKEKRLDCLGLMILNKERTSVKPLVYCTQPESLFWESSCASGTTAVGAYFAARDRKDVCMSFSEPGGTLTIEALKDKSLFLSGSVSFL